MHTESDYIVNIQNSQSRTFTVSFLSKQANSSENVIQLADDNLFERTEAFRLRIVAARFFGQAAAIFRAQGGLSNTIAEVTIEDDDCKFMNTPCSITVNFVCKESKRGPIIICMSCMFSPTVVEVSWNISEPIEVTEGVRDPPELFAQVFGVYDSPIEIGVVCEGVTATGVPPGADTISSTDTLEHAVICHS